MRKGVYSYEYIDDWEKFSKTSLPEKKVFYSNFNMENITDAIVCKGFERKNLG